MPIKTQSILLKENFKLKHMRKFNHVKTAIAALNLVALSDLGMVTLLNRKN